MSKKISSLADQVLEKIRRNDLISPANPLLVAVSGGPDSVCLLHVLHQLQSEIGLKLHVVHLDHQIRGKESALDARYVAQLAKKLGIPATIEGRDVVAYQKKHGLSLEEAAREVRYTFFTDTAVMIGADRVALGHTWDDNIETILLHVIRGSGTQGLRGLLQLSQWRSGERRLMLVRPLLDFSRTETLAYCLAHKLRPRFDTTNQSLSPLRNRVRLELIPLLRSYNPRIGEALQRASCLAGEEMAFLDTEVESVWDATVVKVKNATVINKEALACLHPALQRHLLRRAVENTCGLKDIESHHIDGLLAALPKPAGKVVQLIRGVVFVVQYEDYLLAKDPAVLCPYPPLGREFVLKVPSKAKFGDWLVKAKIIENKGSKISICLLKGENAKSLFKRDGLTGNQTNLTAYFDLGQTGDELTIRSWHAGDRFHPLGLSAPKKLGEFMIDSRIPHAWRSRIPVVTAGDKIIWLLGYRIDERVKVTEKTEQVLRIEFTNLA